jgi:hypothetical protein
MHQNFKLRLDHDVFEDNPELKIIPEFSNLTDRQMKYVMLVEWHGTPLKRMKLEDRKYKAALMVGYKLEKDGSRPDMNMRNLINGKVNTIEAALREMKGIQHDTEGEIMEAFDTQINEIIEFFKKPGKTIIELEKASKMMSVLPNLLQQRKAILEILNFRDENIVNTDEGPIKEPEIKLSILDEYNEEA